MFIVLLLFILLLLLLLVLIGLVVVVLYRHHIVRFLGLHNKLISNTFHLVKSQDDDDVDDIQSALFLLLTSDSNSDL